MKASLMLLLALAVPLAQAAEPPAPQVSLRPPAALAYTTAVNLGTVSTQLSKNQQEVVAMIAERTDAIVARERAAASAQDKVERELEVYRMTRGGALADSLRALMRQGDRAALEPAELDAMEAALRAEVRASAVLPALSTEKLDAAVKKLAVLAEQPSAFERATEAVGFFKATKKAVEELDEDANAEKDKADAAIKTASPPST